MSIQNYKINNTITSAELRVIDESGKNLGAMSKEDALRLAREKGLDLIEIAPQAKPPVAKIISFDKFRYQEEKEEKRREQTQKAKEMKQVRISPRTALNDLKLKMNKAEEFLKNGHKVEINLILRGREKGNKEWGLKKLNEFLALITFPHIVVMGPKLGGRGYVTQLAKK